MHVKARLLGVLSFLVADVAGDGDLICPLGASILTNLSGNVVAIRVRQPDDQQDHLGSKINSTMQCIGTVVCDQNVMTSGPQQDRQILREDRLVLLCDRPDYPARVSGSEHATRYVASDHAPGPDDRL